MWLVALFFHEVKLTWHRHMKLFNPPSLSNGVILCNKKALQALTCQLFVHVLFGDRWPDIPFKVQGLSCSCTKTFFRLPWRLTCYCPTDSTHLKGHGADWSLHPSITDSLPYTPSGPLSCTVWHSCNRKIYMSPQDHDKNLHHLKTQIRQHASVSSHLWFKLIIVIHWSKSVQNINFTESIQQSDSMVHSKCLIMVF